MFGGGSKASRTSSSIFNVSQPTYHKRSLKVDQAAFQVSHNPRHLKLAYYTIHTSLQVMGRFHNF
ncbi:hypothetical protein NC651_037927 [Populus alba x Populus x berolinensis]|nr:hypothetical protein NC651_037927 [Populus alba x Populus x berolinensis]